MDEAGFREFCKEGKRVRKGLSKETIDAHLRLAGEFERFLKRSGGKKTFKNATAKDADRFIEHLIKKKMNSYDNLLGLLRYARFVNNEDVELAILGPLDGALVFGEFSRITKEKAGPEVHKRVFKGLRMPVLGTKPVDWHLTTKKFMERLAEEVDEDMRRSILLEGPHAPPIETFAEERKKLLSSKNVDEYLKKKHQESVELLTGHMRDDTLFFEQRIDQDVLDLVKGNQEILSARREGDTLYVTKIPYMAIEYLREKDSRMKRYHACHCHWVRDAIREGVEISPEFCLCSAAFEKRQFDAAFGQYLDAEVLQSVLGGDLVCRFAIRIPEKYAQGKVRKAPSKGRRTKRKRKE